MRAKKLILSMLVIAIFLWLSQAESWAVEAYMHIEASGGEIRGSATVPGYEHWHPVAAFGHNLYLPVDPTTGQASGQRRHEPVRIVKPVDESSPLLYSALITGEHNLQVEIDFLRFNNEGQRERFFTIRLQDAMLTSISPSLIPSTQNNQMMEIVNIAYRTIIWTEDRTGSETQDSWYMQH